MSYTKKKILLNWDYRRIDLLHPLLEISSEFEFVFIYFKDKNEDLTHSPSLNKIYWSSYTSPYKLINEIKPDKVIFCDVESFHQLALNIACKNYGIRTYHLEHGVRDPNEISFVQHDIDNKIIVITTPPIPAFNTLLFLLRSIKLKNFFNLHNLLHFIYFRRKFGPHIGLLKSKFALRNADYYINFTKENAKRFFERDSINEEQLLLIGNPNFDNIFNSRSNNLYQEKDYILLLDTPLADVESLNFSFDQVNEFYNKLNKYCLSKNLKLYIKLHPMSYISLQKELFLKNDNIIYFTNVDNLSTLIFEAKECLGFFSSILIPIIYYKKCILFETGIKTIQKDWEKLGMVINLPFNSFEIEDINFQLLKKQTPNYKEFIAKYLYSTDGKSTNRLKDIFLN